MTNLSSVITYVMAQIVTKTGLKSAQVHSVSAVDADPSNFPDVIVYRIEDKADGDGISDSSGGMNRLFTFGVTISAVGVDESLTDALATQIRSAVLSDLTLGGNVVDTRWEGQKWGIGNLTTPTVLTNMTFSSLYFWYSD